MTRPASTQLLLFYFHLQNLTTRAQFTITYTLRSHTASVYVYLNSAREQVVLSSKMKLAVSIRLTYLKVAVIRDMCEYLRAEE